MNRKPGNHVFGDCMARPEVGFRTYPAEGVPGMRPLELLKATKMLWGLTASWFAWIAGLVLLILPLVALIWLWWKVRSGCKPVEEAIRRVDQLSARNPFDPRRGLSVSVFNQLTQNGILPKGD